MRTRLRDWIRRFRLMGLRRCGAELPADCRTAAGVRIRPGFREGRPGRVRLGPRCQLEEGVVLDGHGGSIELGENVFLGPYAVIYGHGGVVIGPHVLVSMHCRILSSNHTVPPPGALIRDQPDILLPTRIGRDVWLGAGATVLGGVTVGDGCVVGAGAVVAADLPPFSVAVGVPARVIRSR